MYTMNLFTNEDLRGEKVAIMSWASGEVQLHIWKPSENDTMHSDAHDAYECRQN